jgi:hypothetical protein
MLTKDLCFVSFIPCGPISFASLLVLIPGFTSKPCSLVAIGIIVVQVLDFQFGYWCMSIHTCQNE